MQPSTNTDSLAIARIETKIDSVLITLGQINDQTSTHVFTYDSFIKILILIFVLILALKSIDVVKQYLKLSFENSESPKDIWKVILSTAVITVIVLVVFICLLLRK